MGSMGDAKQLKRVLMREIGRGPALAVFREVGRGGLWESSPAGRTGFRDGCCGPAGMIIGWWTPRTASASLMSQTWTLVSTTWSHGLEIRKTKKALAQGVDVFIFDERHDWEFAGGNEVRPTSFLQLSKIVIADGQDARGVAQVTLVKSQGRFTGRVGVGVRTRATRPRRGG